MERDTYQAVAEVEDKQVVRQLPDLTLKELLVAFKDVLARAEMNAHWHVQREPLSVRERMSKVLVDLQGGTFASFQDLFDPAEGRMGVAVTFLALLELLRERLIELVQAEAFSPIHVRAATGESPVEQVPVE